MRPEEHFNKRGCIEVLEMYFRYNSTDFHKPEIEENIKTDSGLRVEHEKKGNLSKGWVLKNINLQIKEGEFIAIVGANGSGKSTLLKTLNALLLPTRGKVVVDGLDSSESENIIQIRQWVQMVFQVPESQIVGTTVEEDLAFGPENLGLPYEEIKKRIDETSKKVGIYKLRDRDTHTLSGGQKQMLAIGSAVAMRPRWLLLDEPTSMLDPVSRKDVFDLILGLWKEGMGIVLTTHSMEEVLLADRVIVLKEGMILMDDIPRVVFSEDSIFESNLEIPQILILAKKLKKYWPGLKDFYREKTELIEDMLRFVSRKTHN